MILDDFRWQGCCHGVSAVGGRVREPRARRDGGSNVRERSDRPGVNAVTTLRYSSHSLSLKATMAGA